MKTVFLFLLVFLGHALSWADGTTAELPEVYRELVRYEQTYNDKKENLKVFASIHQNDMDPKYFPERQPVFKLDTVMLPLSDVSIIDTTNRMSRNFIVKGKDGREYVPMFVHPESRDLYAPQSEKYGSSQRYWATPTSSHRSMVIWHEQHPSRPIYLKLSINKSIGESLRVLTVGQMERAATISHLLQTLDLQDLSRRGINFIDEPLHIYIKDGDKKTGYTVRSMPAMPEGSILMPMFSLYSTRNGNTPILVDIIKDSGLDAKTFVSEKIIRPMISHMVELAFNEGLIGDNHEQNAAIRLKKGADGKLQWTGQFYYRDLGGYDLNLEMREAAGKTTAFIPRDFNPKYLKSDRADLVDKTMSYLRDSNFFALQQALRGHHGEITPDWIKRQVLGAMQAEIYLRTGVMSTTESTMKSAITRYNKHRIQLNRAAGVGQCRAVFL